ncbi:MAG: HAD family hydrolase [Thermoanaerobaculia bacterium]|nr:HAD family hydrolase [Thermoanaerobaculia bacterium]
MLKAIAFDLWETLITDTPELSREQERLRLTRMEEILASHGFAAEAERIERAYRQLWRRCHDLYWSADLDVPCRRQIEHFLEELQLDPTAFRASAIEELEHAYAHAAVEIPPATVSGALETLAALHTRGFRLGLISNTGRTPGYALRKVLDEAGLGRYIEVMVFSNEHGACKPLPSIFEELRRGLDVAYAEVVFVGDNLNIDVYGAQRCGMRAIHFAPPVRGTAVAPPVDRGFEVIPDAVVTRLDQIPSVIETLS